MNLANKTTLIFDFGGVIINLNKEKALKNFEKIGLLNIAKMLDNFFPIDVFLKLETGEISNNEFLKYLQKASTQKPDKEQVKEAFLSFLDDIPNEKLDLLLELKKHYKILMLSNTNGIHFPYCVATKFSYNNHSINDFFDKCYLSYQIKLVKPHKEIFEFLLRDSNLQPSECLFFDDSQTNLDTAKLLQIDTQLVEPFTDLRKYCKNLL
ncbi:MAG: HAD family phosphatase [Prevotellaceae bacterium]|jgi:putative hydrolase of the HAD superfamily|nr:HAD family phosphatase [Prevotellaceae bacterium]